MSRKPMAGCGPYLVTWTDAPAEDRAKPDPDLSFTNWTETTVESIHVPSRVHEEDRTVPMIGVTWNGAILRSGSDGLYWERADAGDLLATVRAKAGSEIGDGVALLSAPYPGNEPPHGLWPPVPDNPGWHWVRVGCDLPEVMQWMGDVWLMAGDNEVYEPDHPSLANAVYLGPVQQVHVAAEDAGSHDYHGPTANGRATQDPAHERFHQSVGDVLAGKILPAAREQMVEALKRAPPDPPTSASTTKPMPGRATR